ncbi:exodeoxyribonuclease VII large subunit [Lacipirellula limnantheis]|uniref:Exodeoxyribonuclease 7 large subunit n=1 Tax=Lacipirellula limnantheis TaxID=2528024 RepID=A0A517U176_9BACT|nr:exodeoxyribonuclease VII large subunit [Lacipirellula limnantheis]QDT74386.1 Exodeoxyribonuclease 7 large subunit [Lacipirellula limnantheis]
MPSKPPADEILTVTQLSARLKGVMEENFPSVWVAGEISNYSQPQSGHCYFTLKDDGAQLRAVMWRNTAARLKLALHDGIDVVCRGRLDLYPPRGSYQLVVDELQPKGMGALELALRQRREKLAAEGLFDAARKRRLPAFPRRIGVVTSPTGAAIRDFLQVMHRRWRGVEVLVFPARVQGDGAAEEIVAGIRAANKVQPPIDVLVVTRGGGSLEDLWCFNEESVVRAIAASKVPTISGIGHEIDVTLADLAADVRALTPSEAAERVVPSAADLSDAVRSLQHRLSTALSTRLAHCRHRLDSLATRPSLCRPLEAIHLRGRRLDELSLRLKSASQGVLRDRRATLETMAGKLESLSPLGVLGRGYSLTFREGESKLITSAEKLKPGQRIVTRFQQGSSVSVVEQIEG